MENLGIVIHKNLCIHCGSCTTGCKSGALFIDRNSWKMGFKISRCSGCGVCADNCPRGAITLVSQEGYACM